ncbi:MAG: hypothetical protein IKW60_02075 [Clostridia bacterium]|nr:hypothetical protein [Clostridia bacterium]
MKKVIGILLTTLLLMMPAQTFAEIYTVGEEISFEETLPTNGYIPLQLEEQEKLDEETSLEDGCPYMLRPFMAEEEEDLEFADVSKREYYGYTVLKKENLKYAYAYRWLANGLLNKDEEIVLIDAHITKDEFDMVLQAVINDHPELYYLNCSGGVTYSQLCFPLVKHVYKFRPDYIEEYMDERSAAVFQYAVTDILKRSGARPSMSEYDKAIMIHNELAARIQYDNDSLAGYTADMQEASKIENAQEQQTAMIQVIAKYADIHTAYNALVKGTAVCDGYVKAYQYLLREVGILSHMATGYGAGGGHAWNLVRLDGEWYYTDLTWDDNKNGLVFYAYFNMDDAQLADTQHVLDNPYDMPECTSTDLNYYTVNGGRMSAEGDLDHVVAQLRDNSYARVYYTGEDGNTLVLWDWFYSNLQEIAKRVGITSQFYVNRSGTRRELILMLYHDTAAPLKNAAVEVCSMTDRECRVFAGFYDEEDHLIHMGEVQDVELKANSIIRVKFGDAPEEYHTVKYFIWDQEAGMKPLYQKVSVEY